ncbi:glucan biosynthesis protein [Roseibacillus persicicus]|uniref:Glucans biosynthesis protein D n=1 Tax=Roseibacillus persicicus TaxID=454148 RepID=A0A918TEH7_9BACT|nr:glucan biosynthesis protein G [Roseibacillus persicicus]GHC42525.1 putative glucans biosynthesis protein D [Roseibacillus persicicus]
MHLFSSSLLAFALTLPFVGTSVADPAARKFSLTDVEALAKNLASKPYESPSGSEQLPAALAGLNYDQHRAIRNRPEQRIWQNEGLPFRIEPIHSGYLFQRPVELNEVSEDGEVRPLPFQRKYFDYSALVLDEEVDWSSLTGFAGFRIQHPLNGGPEQWDEIGSFAGASYFRLLGQDQRYGISARALALNVANPKAPEEFPDFVEYWLVRPQPTDRHLQVYALLDSPSVTGAFSLRIVPGVNTQTDVNATLYFREEVDSLGIAPLTSMFFYGENSRERHFTDWRPEIHDSDGLLVESESGEIIWRPLVNGSAIRYTAFQTGAARGFGLMQRDRNFFHYQDLDNPYHKTPSYWVETGKGWPGGAVRLVELPTQFETYDNIVSFFEPSEAPKVGPEEPMRLSYILHSKMHFESNLSRNHVSATRVGVDSSYPDTRRFIIDFDGPTLEALDASSQVFAVIDSSSNGYITENRCFKNTLTGGWRVAFKLDTDDNLNSPVELRCFLKILPEERTLTETWTYQWTPNQP